MSAINVPVQTVDPLVNSILREKGDWGLKSKRRTFVENVQKTKAWALGEDEKYSYLQLNPGETKGSFNAKPKADKGVTQIALDQYLGAISSLPVKRTVPSFPDFDLSPYEKNLDLSKIQSTCEISGTVAVRPVITLGGEVGYEMFDASQLYARTQGNVLVGLGVEYKDGKQEVLEVWTPWELTLVVDGKVQSVSTNPYGVIPVSIFRASPAVEGTWLGESDLAKLTTMDVSISKLMTDLMELARDQSYSWIVYSGPLPEEEGEISGEKTPTEGLIISPGRMMTLPDGAKLDTVTPKADTGALLQIIDNYAKSAFEKGAVVSIEKGSEYSSGFALRQKAGRHLTKMGTKRSLFIEADQKLLELAVLMEEVHRLQRPRALRPDFKVRSNYDTRRLVPETIQESN